MFCSIRDPSPRDFSIMTLHSGEEDDLMSPREEAPKKFSKVGSFLMRVQPEYSYGRVCRVIIVIDARVYRG